MHIGLNIKVDCRIVWKMRWLVPWGRKMCKSRLLVLRQHLMCFWLEDYMNKVSCCFETVLDARGLCWDSQGPVQTGDISYLCVPRVGGRSLVPWQNPSTSGACRKPGNWPCWDTHKPRLGFTGELWQRDAVKFSGISTATLSLMNRGGSVDINMC